MNKKIIDNYSLLKPSLFFLPVFLLSVIVALLFKNNALHVYGYINIQKEYFFSINAALSKFPKLAYNLTQMGDALVFLSILSVFLVYAPALWESLISASLLSMIASSLLKGFFEVPRPAATFNHHQFAIVGDMLTGHNSLPSGHSITIFTTLTVLLFAFMPKQIYQRVWWIISIVITGLMLVLTRVAVGAHYPLDVLVGSTVGYTCGLAGIFLSRKFNIWKWIENKKYYPVLFLLLIIAAASLINKSINEHLPVFYAALIILFISLYKLIHVYRKK